MKKFIPSLKLVTGAWIVFFLITDFSSIRHEINSVLKMWSQTLIPSLFPYLVLSQYLTTSGAFDVITPLLGFVRKIFGISPCSVGVYLCSLVCGYPSGAICAGELYSSGKIGWEECQHLVCFTNNAGPLFLISAVGGCMLGSVRDGAIIYGVQCLSAAVVGAVLGIIKKQRTVFALNGQKGYVVCEYSKFEKISGRKSLVDCSQSAVSTMLMIGAYAVIASVIGKITVITFDRLLFSHTAEIPWQFEAVIYAFLDISSSMTKLCCHGGSAVGFATVCACVSWAGVSVMMQIKSVVPKDISIKPVMISKFIQGAISFVGGFLIKAGISPADGTAAPGNGMRLSLAVTIIIFVVGLAGTSCKKTFRNFRCF